MINVSDKVAEENKTHILFSVTFFFLENHPVYANVKSIIEPDRPQVKIFDI